MNRINIKKILKNKEQRKELLDMAVKGILTMLKWERRDHDSKS